jgi:hypothetical protein
MITRQYGIVIENQRDWTLDALLNQSCMKATHCVNAEDPHGEPARVWAEGEGHADNIAAFLTSYGYNIISTEEV